MADPSGGAMVQGERVDERTQAELLASTRRSLIEADQISAHTLGVLDHQTEQLRNIHADAQAIDNNLNQAEEIIGRLGWRGWFKSFFRSAPQQPAHVVLRPAEAEGAPRPAAGVDAARRAAAAGPARTAGPSRSKDEKERTFDEIDNLLDSLKQKTSMINHTLDRHNNMIPDINRRVGDNQERINTQVRTLKEKNRA